MSTTSANAEAGGGPAFWPAISANGQFVAFVSAQTTLVSGDTNNLADVFVKDRATGAIVRVSVASDGTQGNDACDGGGGTGPEVSISANGRYVVFDCLAFNLVAGDTNEVRDVFLRDRDTDADGIFDEARSVSTSRVSVTVNGTQLNGASQFGVISRDGRFVSFASRATNVIAGTAIPSGTSQVYRKDLTTGAVVLVSQSDSLRAGFDAVQSDISANGRYVAFEGYSISDGRWDIYVRDVDAATTTMVSVATDGTQTIIPPTTSIINPSGGTAAYWPAISGNGRMVAFGAQPGLRLEAADVNAFDDVYVRDRDTDGNGVFDEAGKVATFRVSKAPTGADSNGPSFTMTGSLSFDGRVVTFVSDATNLTAAADTNFTRDAFVHDFDADGDEIFHETGDEVNTRVSVSTDGVEQNGGSSFSSVSADGRFVAVQSAADNLVSNDTNVVADIFVHDRFSLTVSTLSVGIKPVLSGNGRYLAFESTDATIVTGDSNAASDVFVHDRARNTVVRVSVSTAGAQANGGSFRPAISRTGRFVAFESDASNLVSGDFNARRDIFLRDRDADGDAIFDEAGAVTTTLVSGSVDGAFGRGDSVSAALSADGRYVVFASDAPNLVFGDTNGLRDVFVRDRTAGQLARASLTSAGLQAIGGASDRPAVSGNGRYVTFQSDATNLAPDDTNGVRDIFVRDRTAFTTTRVSIKNDGSQTGSASDVPSITEDGSLIVFQTPAAIVPEDTNGLADIYLTPRAGGSSTRMSVSTSGAEASGASATPVISADGAYIAFTSSAANLVPGDANGVDDIFIMQRATGLLRRASVIGITEGNGRSFDPSLSADGKTIAFSTEATTLSGLAAETLGSSLRWADAGSPVVIVQAPPPSVSSVTPNRGPTSGGTVVEIRGESLTNIAAVRFGGVSASNVDVLTPSALTVTSPAREAGTVDVQIVGQVSSTIFPSAFTYDDAATACTYALNPAPLGIARTAITTALTVTTQPGCTWSATTAADWITIQGTGSGSGSGSFDVSIGENTNAAPRSATVIVNDATVTITQEGSGCSYTVEPASRAREVLASGGTDNGVVITTGPGCAWTASADVPWLRPTASGSGSATVFYDIDPNSTQFVRSGTLTVQGVGIVVTQLASAPPPTCTYSFAPGSATIGPAGGAQLVTVITGDACPWSALSDVDWITIVGAATGTGTGTVSYSVTQNPGGDRSGTIDFAGTKYTVAEQGAAATRPFGIVDTPTENQTGITGSLAVTGWALDDVEVTAVDITRDAVAGESGPGFYIGRATLVRGARPDIVAAYPDAPLNDRAGWGYLLLTNQLPNGGTGTYRLRVTATDADGNVVELGTRTITCSNSTATTPFGTIDTPAQGETISGSSYVNFGWALTPPGRNVPTDGSTIKVFVDGVNLGSPVYNNFRADIAGLFPGLSNTNGAVGYFTFDTRVLVDRVHTIAWIVTDNTGSATEIGSRFFTVANGTALRTAAMAAPFDVAQGRPPSWAELSLLPASGTPLAVRSIVGPHAGTAWTDPGHAALHAVALSPLDIVHIGVASRGEMVEGYTLVNGRTEALPVGSTLDVETGTFAWQLGPGFKGTYDFVFVRVRDGVRERVMVRVMVE